MQNDFTSRAGDLAQAVLDASGKDFLAAVQSVLDQAQQQIDALGATCLGGGCCCRFDLAGHRLYVSTGELALLLGQPPPRIEQASARRCPYQVGPRCRARNSRPLGCRTYYCGAKEYSDFAELYEFSHRRIQALHEAHGIRYVYAELTSAIAEVFGR